VAEEVGNCSISPESSQWRGTSQVVSAVARPWKLNGIRKAAIVSEISWRGKAMTAWTWSGGVCGRRVWIRYTESHSRLKCQSVAATPSKWGRAHPCKIPLTPRPGLKQNPWSPLVYKRKRPRQASFEMTWPRVPQPVPFPSARWGPVPSRRGTF